MVESTRNTRTVGKHENDVRLQWRRVGCGIPHQQRCHQQHIHRRHHYSTRTRPLWRAGWVAAVPYATYRCTHSCILAAAAVQLLVMMLIDGCSCCLDVHLCSSATDQRES
eukprot:SAG31_NODE_8676_length_1408_cov_1.788388_3_plen_110_part_00